MGGLAFNRRVQFLSMMETCELCGTSHFSMQEMEFIDTQHSWERGLGHRTSMDLAESKCGKTVLTVFADRGPLIHFDML